jgi:hypothetical protein
MCAWLFAWRSTKCCCWFVSVDQILCTVLPACMTVSMRLHWVLMLICQCRSDATLCYLRAWLFAWCCTECWCWFVSVDQMLHCVTCVHDCLHDAALSADVELLVQIRCYTLLPVCMTFWMMLHWILMLICQCRSDTIHCDHLCAWLFAWCCIDCWCWFISADQILCTVLPVCMTVCMMLH